MKRGAGVIGVVVALAVSAAACGSGGGNGAAVSIKTLQAAVSNTQAAPSERFTMTIAVGAAGQQVDIDAEGVASADGKTLQLTMTVPMVGNIEARFVDNVMYMDFGSLGFSGKLPDGKHWVSISLDELQSRTGSDLQSLFDQAQNSGPSQGLEYLQGLSGDVTKLGDDTVAGEHATHYRASIDYAKVAAKLPNTSAHLADKLASLGTVPADVWIDDSDRVVKMHFTMGGAALGADTGNAEFTMAITDFGVPVDVQAPPADETVDIGSLGGIET